jgi:toxin-antitoxin system PIN domain toxin
MSATRSLLDVNVLIALLDGGHASHATAKEWFAAHGDDGWASCPITQNGCVRIMSSPSYPNTRSPMEVAARLREATRHASHAFWCDDVSLLDPSAVELSRIHGTRQLTDAYLLALAVRHGGRFVTFDRAVPRSAVPRATDTHLVVL